MVVVEHSAPTTRLMNYLLKRTTTDNDDVAGSRAHQSDSPGNCSSQSSLQLTLDVQKSNITYFFVVFFTIYKKKNKKNHEDFLSSKI